MGTLRTTLWVTADVITHVCTGEWFCLCYILVGISDFQVGENLTNAPIKLDQGALVCDNAASV